MDDELNILPSISKKSKEIVEKPNNRIDDKMTTELNKLKESLKESKVIGALIQVA